MIAKIFIVAALLSISFILLIPLSYSVYPLENKKKLNVVILDPGHGGKDPGTIGLSGVYEKNITFPIAKKVKDFLTNDYNDLEVYLTRETDEFIEVKSRSTYANQKNGDLFVSIHCNAKKNEENDKNGFEIYILDISRSKEALTITNTENQDIINMTSYNLDSNVKYLYSSIFTNSSLINSERFSLIMNSELTKVSQLSNRGIFQAGYWVLLGASMPSILVECGYLSNKSDESYLKSEKGQEDIAKAIYKAIRLFKQDYDFENYYSK